MRVLLLFFLNFFLSVSFPNEGQEINPHYLENGRVYRITVAGAAGWTDTSLDVKEGLEIYFNASGEVSLQKENPISRCGPEGLDLQTVQQPVRGENLGALVGRVVQLLSVEIDEETGAEKRNELIEVFLIGPGKRVRMPIDGRLYLGVNENVVEDNLGEFRVMFYLSSPGISP